jgi:arabinose-5-phosphate isomerase
MIEENKLLHLARDVLEGEAQAILNLKGRIDISFVTACKILLACQGRIIVTGIGKSGHIAGKIAATLTSTGSPAFFMHPGEASHGDIGIITNKDVVIALSNSGNTEEIVAILPVIKLLGVPLISLTGNPNSILANNATLNLDVSVAKEVCPFGLIPSSSTAASLALGDALAIALVVARGFTAEDFARFHPGGILGKRLLLRVDNLMRVDNALPKVKKDSLLAEALFEMTNKHLGMTTVINDDGVLLGVFTDGDLRRVIDKNIDIHTTKVSQVMTSDCKTIPANLLAVEALRLMEEYQITSLVITNDTRLPVGVIHLHDLLRSGLI